jgi:hypothetical protein
MWKKGVQKILTHSEQCIKSDKVPKMSMEKMQQESVKVLNYTRDESDDHLYRKEQEKEKSAQKEFKAKKKRREDEYNEF